MNEKPNIQDEQSFSPQQTIVSYSGTRHVIGPPKSGVDKLHSGRIVALCGFAMRPDEGPLEAVQDCIFCQDEVPAARRKAEEQL
jgi:hypothetical protein